MLSKIKNILSQLVEFYEFFHVNPSLRLRQLEHVLNTTLSIVGLGFLNKNWKFNILTALKVIITIVYILFSVYTVWYFRDQSVFALQVFCCQGVVLPNIVKLQVTIKYLRELQSYADFGEFLYDANDQSKMKRVEEASLCQRIRCAQKSIRRTYLTLLAMIAIVCFAGQISLFYPAYQWFIKKNHVWIIPILVPFTELDNLGEFYINIAFELVVSSSAILSAICMDLFFALCTCHHKTASKLIEQSLRELSTMLLNKTHTPLIRRSKLINIIQQFQDLNNYASKMNETFQNVLLVQPLIASLSIIISLFCVMVNSWYAGIGFIIFTYLQLFSLCAVGQSVQNNNEQLVKALWDSEWTSLPIEEQRLFHHVLRSAQNAKEFWIGSFAPYNMETAALITQNIYRYLMMLVRVQP